MSLRYVLEPGGAALTFSNEVINTMIQYRQTCRFHRESGGQLFGHFSELRTLIVEATRPKWLDRRSRLEFKPNRWLQRREIHARYIEGLHFVGDWHTHPELTPHPSGEDFQNMKDCFERSVHGLNAFVMVVVGLAPPPAGLHISLIKKNSVLTLVNEPGS